MMGDLIRTSMFCDVNDISAEDELQLLLDLEHSCRDVTDLGDVSSDSDNFLRLIASSSCNQTTLITGSDVTPDQTANQDCFVVPQCCNGDVISDETCQDFVSRVVQASRVDLYAFRNSCASDIFGNEYLQPIVHPQENESAVKQTTSIEQTTSPTYASRRPPYSYAGCAATAIYLSGKYSLSVDDIMLHLMTMFEELHSMRKLYRKRLTGTIRRHALFKRESDGTYSIVPGRVTRNTFQRQLCDDIEKRNRYADKIYDHFGVPSMLTDLGIEPVDIVKPRAMTVLRKRKASVAFNKGSELSANSESDLEMPKRPCFHDDSDNDDDELLIQGNRQNISPATVTSSQDRSSVCPSECAESSETSLEYSNNRDIDKVNGTTVVESLSAFSRVPSVIAPTPRYAVPTPSACIPLRCQEYHIPNVGTFKLVDFFYNGQIIHRLF